MLANVGKILNEYNYVLTTSMEQCYESCLNGARMMLGKSSNNQLHTYGFYGKMLQMILE